MTDKDPRQLEQDILANEELVQAILESASRLSKPMSIEEFKNRLDRADEET